LRWAERGYFCKQLSALPPTYLLVPGISDCPTPNYGGNDPNNRFVSSWTILAVIL